MPPPVEWRDKPAATSDAMYRSIQTGFKDNRKRRGHEAVLAALVLAAGLCSAAENASVKATHVLGAPGIRRNATGGLVVRGGALELDAGQTQFRLPASSITDVYTEQDSVRAIGGVAGTLSSFGPYGSGRFLSLFRRGVDVLSVEYTAEDGGFHGLILLLPRGQGEKMRDALLALGARRAAVPGVAVRRAAPPPATAPKPAARPAPAASSRTIEILRFETQGDLKVLPEFRAALYENLVDELNKKGQFAVFREGQLREEMPGVVTVRPTVMAFEKGSERLRQVTTVAGATSIKVHVRLEDRSTGALQTEKDLTGKVRFFGGNLRATESLAHQVARLLERGL